MRTAINSFFIIFIIMGIVFSCEPDEFTEKSPRSFFELNGEKISLSEGFMDVSPLQNGNYLFEVYLLGNGLRYDLNDKEFENSGDIVQFSLVLPEAVIPSGNSGYLYQEWSDEPKSETFIYSAVNTRCLSTETCEGDMYSDLLDGSITITKVNESYEIDFTFIFKEAIIEGIYDGALVRR